jgi:hypothetical protein
MADDSRFRGTYVARIKQTSGDHMASQVDFATDEWDAILEGPTSAGVLVMTAERGGALRETYSMAAAYVDARRQHGQSELLDAVVAGRPHVDHTRYGSIDELRANSLEHIREAIALLEGKATPEELAEYAQFVVNLAERTARAHGEGRPGDDAISEAERAAIDQVTDAVGLRVG